MISTASGNVHTPGSTTFGYSTAGFGGIARTRNAVVTEGAVGSAVPEPATWTLLLLGFGSVGFALRRRVNVGARIRFA